MDKEIEIMFPEQWRDTTVPVQVRGGKTGHTEPSSNYFGSFPVGFHAEKSSTATEELHRTTWSRKVLHDPT